MRQHATGSKTVAMSVKPSDLRVTANTKSNQPLMNRLRRLIASFAISPHNPVIFEVPPNKPMMVTTAWIKMMKVQLLARLKVST
jgi:hypothetical protein